MRLSAGHRLGLCSVLVFWLSGCGWQLQTVQPLPAELLPVYLQLSDTQSLFARSLQHSLDVAAMPTTTDLSRAGSVLVVTVDQSTRQVSSVSALNQPQQYQMEYRIQYRFDRHLEAVAAHADTRPITLIPTEALSASRTMSYDITLALAKDREAHAVEELLALQLTEQVMRRLNSLSVTVNSVP